MTRLTHTGLLLLALSLTGCARLQLKATYRTMGEFDADHDVGVEKKFTGLRDQGAPQDAAVRVLVDAIPRGLELKDGVITVQDGYEHRILGKFNVAPETGVFPGYRESWRKYVCYPQVPLTWATLGVWYIAPSYYPCYSSVLSAKKEIVGAVSRLVSASGGDVAVMTFVYERDERRAMGATGFIIRVDPRMKAGPGGIQTVPRKEQKQVSI